MRVLIEMWGVRGPVRVSPCSFQKFRSLRGHFRTAITSSCDNTLATSNPVILEEAYEHWALEMF